MSSYQTIDPKTAKEWLDKGEAILVDVREADEHRDVHILDAHLIPLNKVCCDKLPKDASNKKVVVHCKLGGRSAQACEKLKSENPNLEIYNLEGGIVAWESAGLKVHKS